MNQDWRARLEEARKKKKMSKRAVSLAAGMGPGYIFGILNEGKDPGVESLMKVCDVLDVSLTSILYGVQNKPGSDELLGLIQNASQEDLDAHLQLLRSKQKT